MLNKTNTQKARRQSDFVRVRLAPERKRQLRMLLATRDQTFQDFFLHALEMAIAQAQKEGKN